MKEFDLKKLRKKSPCNLTIAEVNALARAEGMSYGEYSVRCNLYQINMKGRRKNG